MLGLARDAYQAALTHDATDSETRFNLVCGMLADRCQSSLHTQALSRAATVAHFHLHRANAWLLPRLALQRLWGTRNCARQQFMSC